MIHTLRSRRNMSMREFVFDALASMGPSAIFPITDELATGLKAQARVDHARWLVDCPFCPNAVLLDPEDPRTFCLSCFNAKADGAWVWVEMPDTDERDAIDAILEDGRDEHLQSWTPGQTLDQLRDGAPVLGPQMHPDFALQLAQSAGEERNRLEQLLTATRQALEEERRGAMSLVHVIERLHLEAGIRKQLNGELQDQIDAFVQHEHEN
jgi:hypothetical protein